MEVAGIAHGAVAGELAAEVNVGEVRVDGLLLLRVTGVVGVLVPAGKYVGEVREGIGDRGHLRCDVGRSRGREGLKIRWAGRVGVAIVVPCVAAVVSGRRFVKGVGPGIGCVLRSLSSFLLAAVDGMAPVDQVGRAHALDIAVNVAMLLEAP